MKRRDITKLADLKLRVPEHLRQMIENSAARNNRTMSAEMIHRLTESFALQQKLEWTDAVMDAVIGPPALRILLSQLAGAFASASEQYAKSKKLQGTFADWNNNVECYETATIATIIALASDAPAGPTKLMDTLRSIARKLNDICRASK